MRRPLRPDEMFPAGSSDISQRFIALSTGIRVRVVEAGPSDGPPVLMLPGWGASAYMYRHALDALPMRGFRALAVDLRGFGLSDRPPIARSYSLDSYLADLLSLLDVLGLDRPALIGQSMGGGLALRFALSHPDRISRLVLINPSGLIPLHFIRLLRLLPHAVVAAFGRRAVPRWSIRFILRRLAYADSSVAGDRDVDEYWAPTQLPGFVFAAKAALSEFDWSVITNDEAAALTTPTLVMLGKSDRLIRNTAASAARLANGTVRILPGGHCVHEEKPRQAYPEILKFLLASDK